MLTSGILKLLVLLAIAAFFTSSRAMPARHIFDPCEALLKRYGTLQDILHPRFKVADIQDRLMAGKDVNFRLGHGRHSEVWLRAEQEGPGGEPAIVVYKKIDSSVYASDKARVLDEYREMQRKGWLPGFEVVRVLRSDQNVNVFEYAEGAEIARFGDHYRGRELMTKTPEAEALWESYKLRLLGVARAMSTAGFYVQIRHDYGDGAAVEVRTFSNQVILLITPKNTWVTVDGKYLITDAM